MTTKFLLVDSSTGLPVRETLLVDYVDAMQRGQEAANYLRKRVNVIKLDGNTATVESYIFPEGSFTINRSM